MIWLGCVPGIISLEKGFCNYDDKDGKVTAKRVILATGINDVLPNKPGFADAFGRGVFWCPWCDGHNYKNRKILVYGKLASAIGSSLNLRKLTTDITIVTGGALTKEDKDDEYKIHLNAGSSNPLVTNGMLISLPTAQTSSLHKQLRLEMDGKSVKVNSNMESSVGGLYVVGRWIRAQTSGYLGT
ncbi:hypothetical protein N7463_010193 [Penicillium fimorum]|uniref:FAD/NAD(P)-binding domain-containing protein n=1 Tax=Penicillium fimorum TaxID=1882269 RepID=A0A9W9XJH1_9EURO|nr:hypothetical protein N7463_010193 [Penicillium fimorum]